MTNDPTRMDRNCNDSLSCRMDKMLMRTPCSIQLKFIRF